MAKPRSGRKQLTSELIDVFVRALDAPSTFQQASAIAGFSERTMRSWIAAGDDEECTDELLLELSAKYAKTMAGGTRAQLRATAMEMALGGSEKMLALMMKAYIPNIEPATNVKVEATHELKKTATLDITLLTEAEARAYELATSKMLAAQND